MINTPYVDNPNCIGTVVLHKPEDIDATTTTHRLHLMTIARDNLRKFQIERTGKLTGTPIMDGAIEHLEELLATHLPAGPGGIN